MKIKIRYIGILIAMLFSECLFAQDFNSTMYFMKNTYQSRYTNPAFSPDAKVYIEFPALSSTYISYSNNSFSKNTLIHMGTGLKADSLVIDIPNFFNSIKDVSVMNQSMELNLFGLGVRSGDMFFSLRFSTHERLSMEIGKDLVGFFYYGNSRYKGETLTTTGLDIDNQIYNQLALDFSMPYDDKLTIGAGIKVLMGVMNVNTKTSQVDFYTSNTGDSLNIQTTQLMQVSLPFELEIDSENNIEDLLTDDIDVGNIIGTKNMGFGIDLGATYKMLDDKLLLSASIIDLGYIKWKNNAYLLEHNGEIAFNGIDFSSEITGSDNAKDPIEEWTDSIIDDMKMVALNQKYSTMLPTKIYLGGTYQLHKYLNVGFLMRTIFINQKPKMGYTLSANTSVGNWLGFSAAYTIGNKTFNNIGLGLSLKGGPLQFHIVTDNILGITSLHTAKNINLRFGLNLQFGRVKKKVDEETGSI